MFVHLITYYEKNILKLMIILLFTGSILSVKFVRRYNSIVIFAKKKKNNNIRRQ